VTGGTPTVPCLLAGPSSLRVKARAAVAAYPASQTDAHSNPTGLSEEAEVRRRQCGWPSFRPVITQLFNLYF